MGRSQVVEFWWHRFYLIFRSKHFDLMVSTGLMRTKLAFELRRIESERSVNHSCAAKSLSPKFLAEDFQYTPTTQFIKISYYYRNWEI